MNVRFDRFGAAAVLDCAIGRGTVGIGTGLVTAAAPAISGRSVTGSRGAGGGKGGSGSGGAGSGTTADASSGRAATTVFGCGRGGGWPVTLNGAAWTRIRKTPMAIS